MEPFLFIFSLFLGSPGEVSFTDVFQTLCLDLGRVWNTHTLTSLLKTPGVQFTVYIVPTLCNNCKLFFFSWNVMCDGWNDDGISLNVMKWMYMNRRYHDTLSCHNIISHIAHSQPNVQRVRWMTARGPIFRRFHGMPWPPNGSLKERLDSRL